MQMFDKDHFVSLNILKKEVYSGSRKGMRYRLEKTGRKGSVKNISTYMARTFLL